MKSQLRQVAGGSGGASSRRKRAKRSTENTFRHDSSTALTGSVVPREMAYVVLLVLLCACAAVATADASQVTINANVYITDSANIDLKNVTSIAAGQTFVLNSLLTEQATNATIGSILGFYVVLRSKGPFQVQQTVQLSSGSLQVIRHSCGASVHQWCICPLKGCCT